MPSEAHPPGQDPTSLRTADRIPAGIDPRPLRVTYTTNKLADHVALKRTGRVVTLELAEPLLNIVQTAGEINDLKNKIVEALKAISVEGIVSHFTNTIIEYVNAVLPVEAFPKTTGLGLVVYLIGKLYSASMIRLGRIHHASLEEFPRWMGLIEEAKQNPDIDVD
jgi:hypothetical protein